ncbi:uncharacterized protein EKO05_0007911 [Ascochyta rabiei]|uniref:Uncharacterized protein n=1 Tax=Didymella rabiei TaxID=5454 RepID=A0A162ZP19_DIDRA|nr:uncharacterized protein EKO05_0007911 [Ascochyta rabiei]KZM20729.1 hypothetical protein ST47_g8122 [Ascochyta rabiei]UPX17565.1 hypothetical protein EKO05_0007911 [Ascochyta rabiei]
MPSPNPPDAVLEFLCDRRFHRRLTFPPSPSSGRTSPYHISYADYADATSTAVVLFFGGLMGGRLSYSPLDQLARTHGIRIIHADRPGMGGSSSVEIEARITAFVDTLPLLLAHLGIAHVALASHSFGTVYLLNALLRFPGLLHPRRPHVAVFAPWVHPQHTGMLHLRAAELLLPGPVIGQFTALAKFVHGRIAPLAGMSAGWSSAVAGSFSSAAPLSVAPCAVGEEGGRSQQQAADFHAAVDLHDADTLAHLRSLIPTFLFAEQVDGVDQDAQLCLRKPRSIPWCAAPLEWDDIDDAVRLFAKTTSRDVAQDVTAETQRRWTIDAFHAQSDGMVGAKGRVWFDACWSSAVGERGDCVYESRVVKGADHDFILDPQFGASEAWLQRVRRAFDSGEGEGEGREMHL